MPRFICKAGRLRHTHAQLSRFSRGHHSRAMRGGCSKHDRVGVHQAASNSRFLLCCSDIASCSGVWRCRSPPAPRRNAFTVRRRVPARARRATRARNSACPTPSPDAGGCSNDLGCPGARGALPDRRSALCGVRARRRLRRVLRPDEPRLPPAARLVQHRAATRGARGLVTVNGDTTRAADDTQLTCRLPGSVGNDLVYVFEIADARRVTAVVTPRPGSALQPIVELRANCSAEGPQNLGCAFPAASSNEDSLSVDGVSARAPISCGSMARATPRAASPCSCWSSRRTPARAAARRRCWRR